MVNSPGNPIGWVMEADDVHRVAAFARARSVADVRRGVRPSHLRPPGAFHVFFQVDGAPDSMALARRIVDEVAVGLAPGVAFGPGGEAICACVSPRTATA